MRPTLPRLPILVVAVLVSAVMAAPAAASGWMWPLAAPHRVVRGFAPPAHDWLPGHRGVDLAGAVRQPILASGPGRVVLAGTVAGVGVVAIRHPGGLETTYEPVTPTVHVGATVAAGTVIGRLRADHSHCEPLPCLHWGLRRDGQYLDPLALLGLSRVRLLPLLGGAGPTWVVPAVSGASVGSSAVVVGWALALRRRRRRPLPAGVVSLADARRARPGAGERADLDARA